MISRKEKCINVKRNKMRKMLVGTVFLIGIVSGSYTVAFAEQDIGTLLTQWFEKQKGESISQIEIAINEERERQTELLKEQLRLEIKKADDALQQYTDEEIEKRIESIRAYAQQLKDSIEIDNSNKRKNIEDQINDIFNRAIKQLENVKTKDNNGKAPNNKEKEAVDSSKDEVITSPIEGEEDQNKSLPIDIPDPVDPTQPEVLVPPVQDDI